MAAVADPEEFGTLSELLEGTRFENTLGVLGLDTREKNKIHKMKQQEDFGTELN
jgi:hypothetical protein